VAPGRFTRLLSAANTATCTQADNVKYHSRGERIAKEAANPWGNKRHKRYSGCSWPEQNSTGPSLRVCNWYLGQGVWDGVLNWELVLLVEVVVELGLETGTERAVKRTPAKDTCRMRKTKPKAKSALN